MGKLEDESMAMAGHCVGGGRHAPVRRLRQPAVVKGTAMVVVMMVWGVKQWLAEGTME